MKFGHSEDNGELICIDLTWGLRRLIDFKSNGSSKQLMLQLIQVDQLRLASQHMALVLKLDLNLHGVRQANNSTTQQNHAEHSPKTWARTLQWSSWKQKETQLMNHHATWIEANEHTKLPIFRQFPMYFPH